MAQQQQNVLRIFANRTALTRAVGALSCAITLDIAYDPVVCPCGHLFDRPAIENWLRLHRSCPISRNHMSLNDITTNRIVADVIAALGFQRDAPNEVPDTVDAATGVSTQSIIDAPFIACSEIPIGVADLSDEQQDYLAGDRLLSLDNPLCNPASTFHQWVKDYIDYANRKMLQRLNPGPPGQHHYLAMRKYTYHHACDDQNQVAFELLNQGYFVYDLFSRHKNRLHTAYVLYSIEWIADGRHVNLTPFKTTPRNIL